MTQAIRKAVRGRFDWAAVPDIPLGRVYLVIGPNVWGKAFTAAQAWENAQKPPKFILFDAPPDAYVDGMGSIVYTPALYYEGEKPDVEGFVPIGYRAQELTRYGVDGKNS